ncbi:Uncharacterised protein g412 [Pycnogonum litorale]
MATSNFVIFFVCFIFVESYVYRDKNVVTIDGVDHCKDRQDGSIHTFTEVWYKDKCERLYCTGTPDHLIIVRVGCGSIRVQPGCHLVRRRKLNYPECCPEMKCNKDAPISNIVRQKRQDKTKAKTKTTRLPNRRVIRPVPKPRPG